MVQQQIIERDITSSRTIEAMKAVPRHVFLPHSLWGRAYDDRPQQIGHDQTISQPYIVSLMTSQFDSVLEGGRILEIGSGCGYQTALLIHMGFEVHSVEIVPELARLSEKILAKLGLSPASLTVGDGRLGLPDLAPFSGLLAAACAADIPDQWLQQLATPGVIVAPVEGRDRQILVRLEKNDRGSELKRTILAPVRFVPLT